MKLYIDTDYKVHTAAGDGLTAVETDVFDGKCAADMEGSRYVPPGGTWERGDGTAIPNGMLAPWKNIQVLEAAQREYEREQYEDMRAALAESPTAEEIAAAIEEGVNSI